MNVRQNLGELLNQVQYRGDSIVVTNDGKPVAAATAEAEIDAAVHHVRLRRPR